MDDNLIIKFFDNNCSPQEEKQVMEWANESRENMDYFVKMKNLHVYSTMPDTSAGNAELESFKSRYKIRDIKSKSKYAKPLDNDNTRRLIRILSLSAAAVLILLLALNLNRNWLRSKYDIRDIISLDVIPSELMDTVYTEKGVKASIMLPDGSKVWLNSDTRILFPKKFIGKSREVALSGEAYFEVEKDSLHPMIIRTNKNFRIEVLGTKFSVKSYDNDNDANATLYSGQIRLITHKRGKEVITHLNPNESVIIKDNTVSFVSQKDDLSKKTAWKEGDLIFDSVKFSEAAKMIERWHGVTIIINNPALLNEVISANFHSESVVEIMELLKFSVGLEYEVKESQVIIK